MGKVVTILCCLLSLQTMSQRETAITYFNRIIALKNKVIDEMKKIIDARDKQIVEYKKQIANLSKNKMNDQKLQDAIQELHFANLKLKQIQEEARLLKDSISAMEIEHAALSHKIEELTKEIQELRKKEEEYEKNLSDLLQSQGRERIYKKARQRATLDVNAGKETTETDRIALWAAVIEGMSKPLSELFTCNIALQQAFCFLNQSFSLSVRSSFSHFPQP